MNKLKTIAIVVTHNRIKLLKRCLENLQIQTLKLDKVLVIDNGSSDGTQAFLDSIEIEYIRQPNLGSAGGWYTGLKYAISKKYDAAWLMDDDGYPHKDAYMLLKSALKKNYACISSVVINEVDHSKFVFPFPILNKNNMPKVGFKKTSINSLRELKELSKDDLYPWAHLFNGALISINSLRHIGNVNRDYFLYGDETDFFFRLREYGEVFSHTRALHFHPEASKRPFSKIKIFYFLRNSIINYKKYYDLKILRCTLGIFYLLFLVYKRNNLRTLISLLIGRDKKYFYSSLHKGFFSKLGINHEQ